MRVLLCTALAVLWIVPGVSADDKLQFHGQVRINYYADSKSDNDAFNDSDTAAARWRFMPTFDYIANKDVTAHLQIRIGQFDDSIWGHRYQVGDTDPAFDLRQGYIQVKLVEGITSTAGIVPLSDKFGDTLFSSDWDFAPLSLVFTGDAGNLNYNYRLGTGKLVDYAKLGKGYHTAYTGSEYKSRTMTTYFSQLVMSF